MRSGYGQLSARIDGKAILFTTHRAIFEATNGAIPEGMRVLHRCDNPPCFNPAHLFIGTAADNTRDMWAKGRQQDYKNAAKGDRHPSRTKPERLVRGEQNNKAKLTEGAVREIRAASGGFVELAKKYGVSYQAVWAVRRRSTWKHVG